MSSSANCYLFVVDLNVVFIALRGLFLALLPSNCYSFWYGLRVGTPNSSKSDGKPLAFLYRLFDLKLFPFFIEDDTFFDI